MIDHKNGSTFGTIVVAVATVILVVAVFLLLSSCDLEYQVNGPPRDVPNSDIAVGPYNMRVYDFDYAGRHYRMFVVLSSQISVVEVK